MKKVDTAHLFMENKCIGCTVMINRAVTDYLRVIPEEIRVHDWWLALICSHFGKISYIAETTLQYRQHSGNMIGGSSFMDYFKSRIKKLGDQREAIAGTYLQGQVFYRLFGDKLSGKKRAVADTFVTMPRMNPVKRRYSMIRYGFWKSGLARNAALFLIL